MSDVFHLFSGTEQLAPPSDFAERPFLAWMDVLSPDTPASYSYGYGGFGQQHYPSWGFTGQQHQPKQEPTVLESVLADLFRESGAAGGTR